MKIVMLTNKHPVGYKMLTEFMLNNVIVDCVVIEKNVSESKLRRIKNYIIYTFPGIINVIRKIRKLETIKDYEKDSSYKLFTNKIYFVKNFNSNLTESILKDINPDLIILGGARIIKENIISIPKIGILNAHPGLLPKYRGVDVILWSIYNGDDIGVTIHFIDKGVDTGTICRKKIIEIEKNDSIKTIREKAINISAELMVKVVKEIIQNKEIKTIDNKKEDGKQYYKMNKALMEKVDMKLKEMIDGKFN